MNGQFNQGQGYQRPVPHPLQQAAGQPRNFANNAQGGQGYDQGSQYNSQRSGGYAAPNGGYPQQGYDRPQDYNQDQGYGNRPSENNGYAQSQGQGFGERAQFAEGSFGLNKSRANLSQYLMRKFKEFDNFDPSWIAQVKSQLKALGKIACLPWEGVVWLRFPYDPSLAFSNYLKSRYKAAWYKHGKFWACEPPDIERVYVDMQMALRGQLVLDDGTKYVFPAPNRNNYNNNGYAQGGGYPQNNGGYPQNNGYPAPANNVYDNGGQFGYAR